MAAPDKVFAQTYAWYKASIDRLLAASAIPAADQPAVRQLVFQILGLANPAAPPAAPDLADFKDNGAAAESLAIACEVIAETLVALGYVKQAVDALKGGGNPAAALAVVGPVMEQIDRLTQLQANSRYPSAFSIGKMLLLLSGDAQANPAAGHEADKLAALLGAVSAADVANAQSALGVVSLLVGSMLDRSFTVPPSDAAAGFVTQAIPSFAGKPSLTLSVPAGINGTLAFDAGPPSAIKASLALALDRSQPIDGTGLVLAFDASAGIDVVVPVAPPGRVAASGDYSVGLQLKRKGNALHVGGDELGATLTVDELGVALRLANGSPSLQFFAKNAKATLKPSDGFLKLILGDGITVGLDVAAQADAAGKLRLTNGTGLHASLPVPTLPTGPFELQLINLGLDPRNGSFSKLAVEISASFGVALGPFAASVDRLGVMLELDLGGATPIAFAFKPPNGIGLSLDAGIVKGGGYLAVDQNGYSGVLELKMLAVDVKAIALLNTQSEVGFSLLLLIFGQFPPIQLSFGFTLTGIGGLIGVQHTASQPALSQALSAGQLDAVLFPENPVANAPQIVSTLRTMFPVRRSGFVIGPMLELGWSTPSLVSVRLGLLVEANQFTLLGQAVVALPPLVSADIALLYLRLDFTGWVVFDPLRIGFDAKLIHSRVAFISIFGQFAFRASFGDQPTFIISAGGFHPHFKEIPSDIPSPFDRVGMSLDIGIVGVSFKGYFAITSATVQAGAELRAWADIGIASIEGGLGFDAICYLAPKFYFEVDIFAYLDVHVFGIDFASIHLDGELAGPGRWHIAGNAKVHTPWPLPDFSVHVDEHFGNDVDTPQVTVDVSELLAKEIPKTGNWSAQLPTGGEAFLSLATIDPGADLLAHPLGSLLFQQKLVPFELRLDKASGSKIKGANEFSRGALVLTQDDEPTSVGSATAQAISDFFAAAQFLEMSQDDKLSKPSFESYTAGYRLASEDFDLGEIVPEPLGYEEADLGAEPVSKLRRRRAFDTYVEGVHGATLSFGAAGRSPLRDRALAQPAQSAAFRVDPAPVTLADKATLAVAGGGGTFTSVWRASQARSSVASVDAARVQVIELAELAA
ncbi:MAG TPA: DUF6603 domain-containing protein [Myxococcota bacterium]|jgi:hypothetical protein|nr:DUF6603 domain-containing protein [Myxococcota bacterium]